ncbi:MAG TPA: amidase [Thermoanaerobaculia bacterium]|jgi:Asp-tRNA(Asn)/Glu-tRNA(Gln) amidotransferase A subunit family amidase|nr:amidase [Thermoanaerobaculia bacterium]
MSPLAADLDTLLARIAERDPAIHAFLPEEDRAGRLCREAAALLARWPRPTERPPLFGVPVGIKDVFRVDGFPTGAGSRLPPEEFVGPEAEAVTLLKRAGALVLGKTVSTEFAYFAPGPTRNPRDPERTPGGSSSGSAAAVAAGLCPLSLGTQTLGSTLRPAAYCGVVGFKPTFGRISTAGVVPLAPSFDHVGLFAADVAGVALAASVLGADWRPAKAPGKRPRLGIPEGPYLESASAAGLAGFRDSCARLAAAGFAVETVPALPDVAAVIARHRQIVAAEAARVHAGWYGRFGDLYSPHMRELVLRGQTVSDEELGRALEGRAALRGELDRLLDRHGLDLWISPAAPGPAPRGLASTGDPVMNIPWTHAGLPAISLPAGQSAEGLPLGLQIAGRWQGDEALLAAAAAIESAL